jgi:primosomal replication protein N
VNLVQLHARVVEISSVRYSPAGLPLIDVLVEHESTLEEAGNPRQIHLRLKSLAMGAEAEKICRLELQSQWEFTGFLASSKNSKSVVFHIQSFQSVS